MLNNVHWCVLLIITLILTWLPNTEAALLKYPLIDLFPGDYGSRCNKTGVETDSTELFSSCNSQLICHRSTCVCPVGHIFQRKLFISSARCVRFEKAICGSDKICQDVDSNVICRNRRCQCPTDYQFGSNGLCQVANFPFNTKHFSHSGETQGLCFMSSQPQVSLIII